jgi:hypothetical protein
MDTDGHRWNQTDAILLHVLRTQERMKMILPSALCLIFIGGLIILNEAQIE